MPTPDDADDLAEIMRLQKIIESVAADYAAKAYEAKDAKASLLAAKADLARYVADLATARPLFEPKRAATGVDIDEALADDTLFALLTVGHAKDAALDAMEAALLARGKPFDSAVEWVDAVYKRGIVSVDARVAAAMSDGEDGRTNCDPPGFPPAGYVSCNRCNAIRPAGSHPCSVCLCPEYRRSPDDVAADEAAAAEAKAAKKARKPKARAGVRP